MDLQTIKLCLDIATSVVALIAAVVAGVWAYTRFIVERGLLPPVEYTIECNALGEQAGKRLVEVLLRLKNVGSSTLVATDIAARVKYLKSKEEVKVFTDTGESKFGRVNFPHSEVKPPSRSSTIPLIPYDTFVQPGVNQIYTLVTAVPDSATFILIWAQFRYAKHPSFMQRTMIKLSRRLGLIHYSLDHVKKPHTVERAFELVNPEE